MCDFQIRVAGDDLVFCAAHFLILNDNLCERLHGHSYRAGAEIAGPLDENELVVDFTAVRDSLRTVVSELDHRVLLPSNHPTLQILSRDANLDITISGRRWSLPADDCLLLPCVETTTEQLARHVAERLRTRLALPQSRGSYTLRVEIDEGAGVSASCTLNCCRQPQ